MFGLQTCVGSTYFYPQLFLCIWWYCKSGTWARESRECWCHLYQTQKTNYLWATSTLLHVIHLIQFSAYICCHICFCFIVKIWQYKSMKPLLCLMCLLEMLNRDCLFGALVSLTHWVLWTTVVKDKILRLNLSSLSWTCDWTPDKPVKEMIHGQNSLMFVYEHSSNYWFLVIIIT